MKLVIEVEEDQVTALQQAAVVDRAGDMLAEANIAIGQVDEKLAEMLSDQGFGYNVLAGYRTKTEKKAKKK